MKRSRGTRESRERAGSLLHGVVVCSTGLSTTVKEDLREKVAAMGGSFDVNLTTSTTHLAAATTDTEKYRVATAMKGVVVVRPDWVIQSCKEGRKLPCERHALPPFEGLRITVTGLSTDRKAELRAMIESGGGEYMGAMEARNTTHLVAEAATGLKYEAAVSPEWNGSIQVVHSRWLSESLSRKLRLPEDNFPVIPDRQGPKADEEREVDNAGQDYEENRDEDGMEGEVGGEANHAPAQQSAGGRRRQQQQPPQPGAGEPSAPPAAATASAATTVAAAAAAAAATNAPEEEAGSDAAAPTDRSRYPWSAAAAAGEGEEGNRARGWSVNNSGGSAAAAAAAAAAGGGDGQVEGVPSKEEALSLPDGDYLSGCRVMIVGFEAEALVPLSLLVRKGCGVRYTSPNEEITHVVLGDRALAKAELVSALESHPCTPPVVKALWLLETCRAGRMLPTDGYLNQSQAAQDRSRASGGGGRGGGGGGGGGGSGGAGGSGGGGGRGGGGASGRRFGMGANRSVGGGGGSGGGGGGHAGDPPKKGKRGGGGDGGGKSGGGTKAAAKDGDGTGDIDSGRGSVNCVVAGFADFAGGGDVVGDGGGGGRGGRRAKSTRATAAAGTGRSVHHDDTHGGGGGGGGLSVEWADVESTHRKDKVEYRPPSSSSAEAATAPPVAGPTTPTAVTAAVGAGATTASAAAAAAAVTPSHDLATAGGNVAAAAATTTATTSTNATLAPAMDRVTTARNGGPILRDSRGEGSYGGEARGLEAGLELRRDGDARPSSARALRPQKRQRATPGGEAGGGGGDGVGGGLREDSGAGRAMCGAGSGTGGSGSGGDGRRRGLGGSGTKRRRQTWMFRGRVFVVYGTGLEKEEEARMADLVVRHGGLCLDPSTTINPSPSRLRKALQAAGVALPDETKNCEKPGPLVGPSPVPGTHDRGGNANGGGGSHEPVSDGNGGGGRGGGGGGGGSGDGVGGVGAIEPSQHPHLVSCSTGSSPRKHPTAMMASCSSPPRLSGLERGGSAVTVVGKHGRCPWASLASGGGGGGGGGCNDEKGVRAALEIEARAEVVSLLWVEACHRAGELRRPGPCEQVFRPQRWWIRTFPEFSRTPRSSSSSSSSSTLSLSSAAAAAGGDGAKENGARERPPVIAVTGFVGDERAGWEQLIRHMGAEMCKSLKKRVTTHLVCKEATGDKYERALQWGVPVVTADWLLRCAEHGYEDGTESHFAPRRPASSSQDAATTTAADGLVTAPGDTATAARNTTSSEDENRSRRPPGGAAGACGQPGQEIKEELFCVELAASTASAAATATATAAATVARTSMPSDEKRPPQLPSGVAGADRAIPATSRDRSGVAGATVKTDQDVKETPFRVEPEASMAAATATAAVTTVVAATVVKKEDEKEAGMSGGRSPSVSRQAPPRLPRPQNFGVADGPSGDRPRPSSAGGVARDLFAAGGKAEAREDGDSSSCPRGDGEGGAEAVTPVALKEEGEEERPAMEADRAASAAAVTVASAAATAAAAIDTSPVPSPPPPLRTSARAGAPASNVSGIADGSPVPGRPAAAAAATVAVASPSAPLFASADKTPGGSAASGAGTSSGLEQQLLSMLSASKRSSTGGSGGGGMVSGVGVHTSSLSGGAAGGVQRLPRGRRPLLSAWSTRATSGRAGPPSLSTGAKGPAASGAISPSSTGGAGAGAVAAGSPRSRSFSSPSSSLSSACRGRTLRAKEECTTISPGGLLFSAGGAGGGDGDEHGGDGRERHHGDEQSADGAAAAAAAAPDVGEASTPAPPLLEVVHRRSESTTGEDDHEGSGMEDGGLADGRGKARPLPRFDPPGPPPPSAKRKARGGVDGGSGLWDSALVDRRNERVAGCVGNGNGGASKRRRGEGERGSLSGGGKGGAGGAGGAGPPLPVGQENERPEREQRQQHKLASASKPRLQQHQRQHAGRQRRRQQQQQQQQQLYLHPYQEREQEQEREQDAYGMEEESQIVTYGEQYNPATGWTR